MPSLPSVTGTASESCGGCEATLSHHSWPAAVVLAHNHPSGEVTPSKADRLITERLVQALGLVDIRVPDHLIVGGIVLIFINPFNYRLIVVT